MNKDILLLNLVGGELLQVKVTQLNAMQRLMDAHF